MRRNSKIKRNKRKRYALYECRYTIMFNTSMLWTMLLLLLLIVIVKYY